MTYTAQHKLFTVMLVSTQSWKVSMLIFIIDYAIFKIIIIITVATHVILIIFFSKVVLFNYPVKCKLEGPSSYCWLVLRDASIYAGTTMDFLV